MTSTSPDEHFQVLMHRAWDNFLFIRDRASDSGPYEVTQLLMTFLVAVGHPRERKIERELNNLELHYAVDFFGLPQLADLTYRPRKGPKRPPLVEKERPFDPTQYLGDQIEILRNAIAHGNISFSNSDATEDIDEIRLTNIHGGSVRDSVTITFAILEEYTRVCILIADHFFKFRDQTRSVFGPNSVETGIIEWPRSDSR